MTIIIIIILYRTLGTGLLALSIAHTSSLKMVHFGTIYQISPSRVGTIA